MFFYTFFDDRNGLVTSSFFDLGKEFDLTVRVSGDIPPKSQKSAFVVHLGMKKFSYNIFDNRNELLTSNIF